MYIHYPYPYHIRALDVSFGFQPHFRTNIISYYQLVGWLAGICEYDMRWEMGIQNMVMICIKIIKYEK